MARDLLTHLARRAVAAPSVVRPRLPSPFETTAAAPARDWAVFDKAPEASASAQTPVQPFAPATGSAAPAAGSETGATQRAPFRGAVDAAPFERPRSLQTETQPQAIAQTGANAVKGESAQRRSMQPPTAPVQASAVDAFAHSLAPVVSSEPAKPNALAHAAIPQHAALAETALRIHEDRVFALKQPVTHTGHDGAASRAAVVVAASPATDAAPPARRDGARRAESAAAPLAITIGRIDVRAPEEAPPPRPVRAAAAAPGSTLSLADYLSRREALR